MTDRPDSSPSDGGETSVGGIEAAAAAMEAAAPFEGPPPSDRELARLPKNDKGNADRLLARYGNDLLVVDELTVKMHRAWLVWDPEAGIWRSEAGWAEAMRRAHATADPDTQEIR